MKLTSFQIQEDGTFDSDGRFYISMNKPRECIVCREMSEWYERETELVVCSSECYDEFRKTCSVLFLDGEPLLRGLDLARTCRMIVAGEKIFVDQSTITHCRTGVKSLRTFVMTARLDAKYPGTNVLTPVLQIELGGVTGFESFYATPETVRHLSDRGWLACAGTPGRWDSMKISAEAMKRAFKYFGITGDGN